MSPARVRAVAGVELRQLLSSRDYWIPMALLAGLFFVVIPTLLLVVIEEASRSRVVSELSDLIGSLPAAVQEGVRGDTDEARASYVVAVHLLAPIAIVVPLTIAAAVGAATIVGERERGTGEFLAHSPVSATEIYAGKVIASMAPALLATVAGFAVYSLLVNLMLGGELGGWFFPTASWWVLIFWVVPPFIAVALSVIVRLSARVRSTAAAQQIATLVALPTILAAYAISSGIFLDPEAASLLTGAAAWVLAWIGLRSGSRALRRERLLGVGAERTP